MKKWLLLLLTLSLAALAACTPTIYGVPQPTWDMMSEAERVEAMRIYEQRQIAYQKAREERARQRAIERRKQQAREAKAARQRQKRIDAIYRGEGIYGDLLRVTLRKGRMRIGGKHRGYQPVSFRIANGETKKIDIYSVSGRRATLQVTYDDGTLVFDGHGRGNRSRARRLVYERSWGQGKTYSGIRSEGPLRLRNVATYVEIIGNRGRTRANEDAAQVIIIQQSPSKTHPSERGHRPGRRHETAEGKRRDTTPRQPAAAGERFRRSAAKTASAPAPKAQVQD
ncbi:MAG: hypothetical protein GWO11_00955, partial [Desulfuromonadales bacterium]|nr:hypothetical protein [Desulfuromonadales bacterium]NIR33079.1 hypothetical protein [Desulfuromonadales bacterium]NIS39317.1 hypothetical protein [Desulfuromonadales bacterium]